jgi:hypothetical protein
MCRSPTSENNGQRDVLSNKLSYQLISCFDESYLQEFE